MAESKSVIIAAVVVVIIAVAAVGAYMMMGGDKGSDSGSEGITLTLNDNIRVGEYVNITETSGSTTVTGSYVVTAVNGDVYTVGMKGLTGSAELILTLTMDKGAILEDLVFEDTSSLARVGTVTKETGYGKLDLVQYSLVKTVNSVSTTYVYDIHEATGVVTSYTATTTSGSYTVDQTTSLVSVNGERPSALTFDTVSVSSRSEYYANDYFMALLMSYASMGNVSQTEYQSTVATVTSVTASSCTVSTTSTDSDGESTTSTETMTESQLFEEWNVSGGSYSGESITYIGREIILTQYGYVNAAKYSTTLNGYTAYFYADATSGAGLAVSAHIQMATTTGTVDIYVGSCIVSTSFTAS